MKLLYISMIRIMDFEQQFRERLALFCPGQSIAPYIKKLYKGKLELDRESGVASLFEKDCISLG